MNSKSATPSGSQRARAPGGWMKASAEAVRDLLSGLPQPWSTPAMLLDLDAHADREAHTGEPMPGRRALAARWGVGERVARTVIDRWHAEGPVGSARHRPAAAPGGVPPRTLRCRWMARRLTKTVPRPSRPPSRGVSRYPSRGSLRTSVLMRLLRAPQTTDYRLQTLSP